MVLIAALALAYGPLNWSLPWWLWTLCVLHALGEGTTTLRLKKD